MQCMPSGGARRAMANGPKAGTSMTSSRKLAVQRDVAVTFFMIPSRARVPTLDGGDHSSGGQQYPVLSTQKTLARLLRRYWELGTGCRLRYHFQDARTGSEAA